MGLVAGGMPVLNMLRDYLDGQGGSQGRSLASLAPGLGLTARSSLASAEVPWG